MPPESVSAHGPHACSSAGRMGLNQPSHSSASHTFAMSSMAPGHGVLPWHSRKLEPLQGHLTMGVLRLRGLPAPSLWFACSCPSATLAPRVGPSLDPLHPQVSHS